MDEVVLAHPLKTRLIADAQIKTDRLDAFALGTLLRGNLVARAHTPGRATRARKNLLRGVRFRVRAYYRQSASSLAGDGRSTLSLLSAAGLGLELAL